jgi:uncharacterized membrane protein
MSDPVEKLPLHIEEAVQQLTALRERHHRRGSAAHRIIERSLRSVSRPRFAVLTTLFIGLWVAFNLGRSGDGFDPPPFDTLQSIAGFMELYLMLLLLINQRREDERDEMRDQLTLELALLNEQKSAKIIALLEQIRRDSPYMSNHIDHEAAALSVPADPQAVSAAIERSQEDK